MKGSKATKGKEGSVKKLLKRVLEVPVKGTIDVIDNEETRTMFGNVFEALIETILRIMGTPKELVRPNVKKDYIAIVVIHSVDSALLEIEEGNQWRWG